MSNQIVKKLTAAAIVPYYNGGKYFDETFASLRAQKRPFDEIIIVNDGSTDKDSLTLLQKYEHQSGVRVIHQKNAGVASALNAGAQNTRSDILFEVDVDDIYVPEYVQKFMAVFENDATVDGVTCGYKLFFDGADWRDEKNFHRTYMPTGLHVPELFFENCAGGSNAAFRKSALEKIDYWDRRFSAAQDWGMWLQFCEHGLTQKIIPEYLYYYRVHKDGLAQRAEKQYDFDRNLALSMSRILHGRDDAIDVVEYRRQKIAFLASQKIIDAPEQKLQNHFSLRRVSQLSQEFFLSVKREGARAAVRRARSYLKHGRGKINYTKKS